jgi:hypothetical protein
MITKNIKTLLLAGALMPFTVVGAQADISQNNTVVITFDDNGQENGTESFSVRTLVNSSTSTEFEVFSDRSEFYDDVNVSGNLSLTGSISDSNSTAVTVNDGLDVTGSASVAVDFDVDGATTLDDTTINGTTTVVGTTTINTTSAASSNDTTIGWGNSSSGNTTSILSNAVNVGTGAYTTTVNVGSTQTGTTVNMNAGQSELDMNDTSIRASVTDGTADTGAVVVANSGTQYVSNNNGLITTATGDGSAVTAAVVVSGTNGVRGLVVEQTETTLSGGGARAASLTLNANGATFSNPADGSPVQVHGVADGTADFDAVNVRQLYGGLAAVLASAPDLALAPGRSAAAVGLGSYGGFNAVGLGIGHMYDNGSVISASVSKAPTSEFAYRAGFSWTW